MCCHPPREWRPLTAPAQQSTLARCRGYPAIGQRGSENPYKVLQVDPSAEQEVIEAAYRRLVRKYHPDVNSAPAAEAKMRELIDAYAVVRDPARRAEFDRRRGPWTRLR